MRARASCLSMAAVVALTFLPLLGSVMVAGPASAHQDGCHRWHSCPSDSGSYACGDLGYDNECGTFGGVDVPEPVYDYNPPRQPRFATPTAGPRGMVRIPVQAEQGSSLVIKEGDRVVATATGTGALQTLVVYASTGSHTYRAVATDAAGNRSLAGKVTVEADATPPTTRGVDLAPGTPSDSRSHLRLITDPGTHYLVQVDGHTLQRGLTADGEISQVIDLADGRHHVAVELRDSAGNVQRMTRPLSVRVPALQVTTENLSTATDSAQVFRVEGTPNARATLRIPGVATETFRLTEGARDVTLDLPDGQYAAPIVSLADSQGRRGSTRLSRFVVDTTAPALLASALRNRTEEGVLAAVITSDAGSSVAWRLLDDTERVVVADRYVADGTQRTLVRDVAEGDYLLELTAADPHGNVTTQRISAHVAADPLTLEDFAYASLAVALLLMLLAAAMLVWRRNRHRLAMWREKRRLLADQRQRERQHAAALAAHERAVARYREQAEEHKRDDARWQQRRAELQTFLDVARTARGDEIRGFANVKLRRGERVYGTVSGSMVEMRTRQGVQYPAIVDSGRLTVTDSRVVFNGSKKREWSFEKLEDFCHVDQDRTMMKVSNRKTWSGFTYADAEKTRLYIDLALADRQGARARVVEAQGNLLHQHEVRRPQPPTPPGPPPAPPQNSVDPRPGQPMAPTR